MKPLYSGHPWDVANWLLYKLRWPDYTVRGDLLIQVCDMHMAALDRFRCISLIALCASYCMHASDIMCKTTNTLYIQHDKTVMVDNN